MSEPTYPIVTDVITDKITATAQADRVAPMATLDTLKITLSEMDDKLETIATNTAPA